VNARRLWKTTSAIAWWTRPSRSLRWLSAEVTVNCPSLGDSISEGTLAQWVKQIGEPVGADDAVVVIETDKISSEVRAGQSGKITKHLVPEGSVIAVGSPLFSLEPGAAPNQPVETKPAPASPQPSPVAASPAPSKAPASESKPKSSEKTTSATVSAASPGSRSEKRVPMTRMRLRISERLKESQTIAASLTTFNEIDMSNIMAIRSKFKDDFLEKHGVKLGFMSAFVKASVVALHEFPSVNAIIDGKDVVYRDYVDVSVAVATPNGLVVPVLRSCENMSFAQIEKGIVELGNKARKGQLAIEDMAGGTFTISNGGVYGSLFGTPIINMPQSAILGMHGIFDRPVAVNGEVKIRPMMYVALTYDHRIIDGREAVSFLRKIKQVVEDPVTCLLEL